MPGINMPTHNPGICALDGCSKKAYCRGWCSTHYSQVRRGVEPHLTLSRNITRKVCKIQDCGRIHDAKGYCKTHYNQYREGKPFQRKYVKFDPSVPASEIINAFSKRDEETGCLVWQRATRGRGYGVLRGVPAHREAYKSAYGEIPDGMVIDHKCHNPPCVEPTHLRAITVKENAQNLALSELNTTGMRNVYFVKGKWLARLRADGIMRYGGSYETFQEACDAAVALRAKYYRIIDEEFTRADWVV